MGDLILNPGYEGAYDDYYEDEEYPDDYDIADLRQHVFDDGADEDADEDDEQDVPGDHDVVMLDINKFRR